MLAKYNSLIPNSTLIPNVVLDDWVPKLKDVELRVLLIIARQTLGWIEDSSTGRRKEKDWISRGQLMKKTGKSRFRISRAIDELTKLTLIQTLTEKGRLLENSEQRKLAGCRIFYRLTLHRPQKTLFDQEVDKLGKRSRETQGGGTKRAGTICASTKETDITKDLYINNKKFLKLRVDKKHLAEKMGR